MLLYLEDITRTEQILVIHQTCSQVFILQTACVHKSIAPALHVAHIDVAIACIDCKYPA